jgi:hypothetical protein
MEPTLPLHVKQKARQGKTPPVPLSLSLKPHQPRFFSIPTTTIDVLIQHWLMKVKLADRSLNLQPRKQPPRPKDDLRLHTEPRKTRKLKSVRVFFYRFHWK